MLGKHYCYEDHYSAIIVTCQVFAQDLFANLQKALLEERLLVAISFLAKWHTNLLGCGFPLVIS